MKSEVLSVRNQPQAQDSGPHVENEDSISPGVCRLTVSAYIHGIPSIMHVSCATWQKNMILLNKMVGVDVAPYITRRKHLCIHITVLERAAGKCTKKLNYRYTLTEQNQF